MTQPPPADRILLVGMMGAGKSTVGRELARRTGWPGEPFVLGPWSDTEPFAWGEG